MLNTKVKYHIQKRSNMTPKRNVVLFDRLAKVGWLSLSHADQAKLTKLTLIHPYKLKIVFSRKRVPKFCSIFFFSLRSLFNEYTYTAFILSWICSSGIAAAKLQFKCRHLDSAHSGQLSLQRHHHIDRIDQ
jgi:hypothetical protein